MYTTPMLQANLNWRYSKYAKVAHEHYFLYNCILRNFEHFTQHLHARKHRVELIHMLNRYQYFVGNI